MIPKGQKAGWTIIELIVVLTVAGILASAFTMTMVPLFNVIFNFPQTTRVQNAAADLLQIIVEGDSQAKGLRYTGPSCVVGGAGGGGSMITVASASGDVATLEYNYGDSEYCGSGARISHTVVLTYDRSLGTVTRAIDGGTAVNIPSYVSSSSDVSFSVSGGGTDLFHYFDSAGTDLGAAPTVTDIARVDIDVIASSGTGTVQFNSTQIRLKTGVEIKRYTT